MTTTDSTPLADLLGRAGDLEERVRALVGRRRLGDPNPDDPFRGLYVSDDLVDRLLAQGGQALPAHDRSEAAISLERLRADAGLTELDVELLIIAALPDLDPRFERLYGYLNDDVTRRRASIGLALELAEASAWSTDDRGRLQPSGPLLRQNLIIVEDGDRPFLTRALRVPDRVVGHLLGDERPDAALASVIEPVAACSSALARQLGHAVRSGVSLVHVRERMTGTGTALAVAALAEAGRPSVVLDLDRLIGVGDPVLVLPIAVREALLRGAGLVIGPVDALATAAPEALYPLVDATVSLIMVGRGSWQPQWLGASPLLVDAPPLGGRERAALWQQELDNPDGSDAESLDPIAWAGHLALGPGQVRQAIQAARASAQLTGKPLSADDLRRGVRAQNAAGLERLARRIEPEVSWDDLVLAPPAVRALRELTARARHRDTVLIDWRMRRGGGRGNGVTALFAGDSGTGKTMSAEVIAHDLGLDLYTINLATVVDKYVGETEKNLERIFTEAAGVNAVLFFDEADAIFGKRSEVRDAHDRYANIESAYLLQRLESFDGLAVLATNLRANIDEAFTRRLDMIVDFAAPTADLRLRLWQRCLARPLPSDDDLDLGFLADAFELAGGNIRSAATTAAYLAAAAATPVSMKQLIVAVEQEYRKLGRLVGEREFGRYLALIR